jgi:hypothetical protein
MIKEKFIIFAVSVITWSGATAQFKKTYTLSDTLFEISGLAKLNDSTLIAINDGGNSPDLYLLSLKGSIQKVVRVKNAINTDWEDLSSDETYLYIADIGNNNNDRKDLCIYKVALQEIAEKENVYAEKIKFKYADQDSFPPKPKFRNYDAEGIAVKGDVIMIFSKNRTKPWTGSCKVYELPKKPGDYMIESKLQIEIGKNGWMEDAVTAADIYEDTLYLLTYNKVIVKKWINGHLTDIDSYATNLFTQTESILRFDAKSIYIADENHPLLGGGNLYLINK